MNAPRTTCEKSWPRHGSEDPNTVLLPVVLRDAMKHGSDTVDPMALVGREALLERLTNLLLETYNGRASYLLGGYRGAGKTNVANRAIERYEKRLRGIKEETRMTPRRALYYVRASKGNREAAFKGQIEQRHWTVQLLAYARWYLHRGLWRLRRAGLASWYLRPGREQIKDFFVRKLQAKVSFLGPVTLRIRVNLSKENLTARDVMFEITSMLRTRVQVVSERNFNKQLLMLFVAVLALTGSAGIAALLPTEGLSTWSQNLAGFAYGPTSVIRQSPLIVVPSVLALSLIVAFSRRSLIVITFATLIAIVILMFAVASFMDSIHATLAATEMAQATSTWLNFTWLALAAIAVVASVLLCVSVYWFTNISRLSYDLSRLHRRIVAIREREMTIRASGVSSSTKFSSEPLDEHKIEEALIRLLDRNSTCWSKAIDPIFVIDELDKLGTQVEKGGGESEGTTPRLQAIERVLGNLKHLLTVAKARFIVIAGRDMLDRYQAERRLTSSLYETLFDQYFEVPSLLTDSLVSDVGGFAAMTETYVCRRLMRPQDAVTHWIEYKWAENCGKAKEGEYEIVDGCVDGVDPRTDPSVAVSALKAETLNKYIGRARDRGDRNLMYVPYRLPVLRRYLKAERQAMSVEECEAQTRSDIENVILLVRHFIHYLTFYSAGNCKKLESLFDGSVRPIRNRPERETDWIAVRPNETAQLYLRFSHRHQRRFIMGSMLYVSFYHHMSRQLRIGGDKLAVSTLVALHHVLKFHGVPFSRHQLELIINSDETHRTPEINHLIDTLISMSLRGILLKINGGLYQFRFNYAFEQELIYISRTSDVEAATYNFSLSAMENTRVRLRRELENAYRLFGTIGVSDVAKGASVIADLNTTLGEVHVVEQDLHRAEKCFETACDSLKRAAAGDEFNADLVVQLIEAYLKMGLVHERRLRLDRAAAAYSCANELVGEWVSGDNEKSAALAEYFSCRPTRRDLLIQPYLALGYLQLKRNPAAAATGSGMPPNYVGNKRLREPAYNYQRGLLAFYAGDFEFARTRFIRAILHLKMQRVTIDEENASLGAAACMSLAETTTVMYTQQLSAEILEQTSGTKRSAKEQAGRVFRKMTQFLELPKEKEFSFTSEAKDVERLQNYLIASYEGQPRFSHAVALCLLAGSHLMGSGKYYRAGVAYMRGVSLWCMCFELFAVDLLTSEQKEELRAIWISWRQTIAFLVKRAERNLSDSDDRSVMRFKETFLWRDAKLDEFESGGKRPGVSLRKILLAPGNDGGPKAHQIHWHDGLMVQQLLWTTVWGDLLGDLINEDEDEPNLDYIAEIQQRDTPLCSTRALTFSHWLHGRQKLRELEHAIAKRARLEGAKARADLEKRIQKIGAQAVQNLYSATNHLKILASNDQSLMFPPQAFVFFHLWKVLFTLVNRKNEGEDSESYVAAVVRVRQWLIKRVKGDTPACYLDLRYVKDRALRYLRAAENMSDISGRVRAEIIRGKHFLAGDYIDPQFHLEWTLIQSMQPTAKLLQIHIKEQTELLQGTKNYDKDSLWDYLRRNPGSEASDRQ